MNIESLIALFKKRTGYSPNLNRPETYCEKALWSKINQRDPRLIEYGSKLGAKNHINGSEIAPIPTLAINPMSTPELPVMVRLNAYSGYSRVIHSRKEWIDFMNRFPNDVYGYDKGEWHYQYMNNDVIVEPVIKDFTEVKFFCFGGKVHWLYLVEDDHKTFFTPMGDPLPVQQQVNRKVFTGSKFPSRLPKVSHLIPEVEKLAGDLPHVRVDLMITPEQSYLTEFTFFHFSGMLKFHPKQFDYELGKAWQIPETE